MRIAKLKAMNEEIYDELSLESREKIKEFLRDVNVYALNSFDYELIKMDLYGLFKEAEITGKNVNEVFPEEVDYCGEIVSAAKSKTPLEYAINIMPKVVAYILLFYLINYGVYHSFPATMNITGYDLVFWFLVCPVLTVGYDILQYKTRINTRPWNMKIALFGCVLAIAMIISYLSYTFASSTLFSVKGYVPVLVLIGLVVLLKVIYEMYYRNYACKNHNLSYLGY